MIPQLYVDNQQVVFFTDEAIKFTKSIKNYRELIGVLSDFIQEFTVPANQSNDNIFKSYVQIDAINGINPHKAIPAQLIVSSDIIFGTVELTGCLYTDGEPNSYTLRFYGSLKSLKTNLEGSISSLDWSEYDDTVDYNTITNSWVNAETIFYPFMIKPSEVSSEQGRGDWIYQPDKKSKSNVARVDYDITTDDKWFGGILIRDFSPSILFTQLITDIIFKMSGFTVSFDPEIQSTFDMLYIMPGKKAIGDYVDEQPQDVNDYVSTQITSPQILPIGLTPNDYQTIPFFKTSDDGGHWNDTTHEYTCYIDGYYEFFFSWSGELPGGLVGTYYVAMEKNGVEIYTAGYNSTWPDGRSESFLRGGYFATGDVIRFGYVQNISTLMEWIDCGMETTVFPTRFTDEYPMEFRNHLPDVNGYDVIRSMIQTWNLIPIIENNNVHFIDSDTYYANGEQKDWTDYMDISKTGVKKTDLPEILTLAQAPNDASINETFKSIANRDVGQLNYYNDTDFGSEPQSKQSLFSIFPMAFLDEIDEDGVRVQQTDIIVHRQCDDEGRAVNPDFILFYRHLSLRETPFTMKMQNGWDGLQSAPLFTDLNLYPLISMFQDSLLTNETKSLSYNLELGPSPTVPVKCITQLYFERELQNLSNPITRNITKEAILPWGVYLNSKMNDIIIDDGVKYIIKDIEYDLLTTRTKLSLITYIPTAVYIDSIVNLELLWTALPTFSLLLTYNVLLETTVAQHDIDPSSTFKWNGKINLKNYSKYYTQAGAIGSGGSGAITCHTLQTQTINGIADTFYSVNIGETVLSNNGFTFTQTSIIPDSRDAYTITIVLSETVPTREASIFIIEILGKQYNYVFAENEPIEIRLGVSEVVETDITLQIKCNNNFDMELQSEIIIK